MASPKQIAYLTYMGVENASSLTASEASTAIENISYHPDSEVSLWREERSRTWSKDRLILHPDLYLEHFLRNELPNKVRNYVRGRVTGASGRLTAEKIDAVISALQADDWKWWNYPNFGDVFLDRLRVIHPECVDGVRKDDGTVNMPAPKKASAFGSDSIKGGIQQRAEERQKITEVWATIDVEHVYGPSVETLEAIRRDSGRYEPESKYWRLLLYAAAAVLVLLAGLVAFSLAR